MSKSRARDLLIMFFDRVFAGLAICGVLLAFTSGELGRLLAGHVQLPLSGMHTIAVDQSGNVYCASRGYRRIQIYDSEGKFIEGLHIPMSRFMFYVDADDSLHVWSHYKQYRKYDSSRELVVDKEGIMPPVPSEHDKAYVQQGMDLAGNKYEVGKFSWIWPYVTKTTPDGETRVLVSQPFYLWLMRWPRPALLYIAFAGVYFLLVRKVIGPQHPAQGNEQTESECAP